jgi:hypothetical protein
MCGLFDFFRKLIEPAFQLIRIVVQGVCDSVENIRLVGVIAQRFNEFQTLLRQFYGFHVAFPFSFCFILGCEQRQLKILQNAPRNHNYDEEPGKQSNDRSCKPVIRVSVVPLIHRFLLLSPVLFSNPIPCLAG